MRHKFLRYRTHRQNRSGKPYVLIGVAAGDEEDEVWTRRPAVVRALQSMLDVGAVGTRGEWERDICTMLSERGMENGVHYTKQSFSAPNAATRMTMAAERIFEHLLDARVLRLAKLEDLQRRSAFLDKGSKRHFVVDDEVLVDWVAERLVIL
jgi:hypothetical protein